MLSLNSNTKIYLAAGVTDLRKSFDTLAAIVTNSLRRDVLSGDFFVFCNRSRNRLKILVWEQSGYWLLAKRLEKGTFAWPGEETTSIECTPAQLSLLLGGIDLRETKKRKWYRRGRSSASSTAKVSRQVRA